jgi:hypothetical protein
VPADLVDTYADAAYTTPQTTFAPGATVYARGGLAGSTGSYRFVYTNPSATVVRDTGCIVRNLSDINAFDSLTLAANAPGGTWNVRFIEYGSDPPRDTTCTSVVRDRSTPFTVLALLTPTVSTTIHNAAHAAVTTVPVGTTVHDFVKVDGGTGNPVPTGSVTVDWFTNGACSGPPVATSAATPLGAAGTVDVTAFSFTVNSAGDRAFKAHYSGGGGYTTADGGCETLNVADDTVTTVVRDASGNDISNTTVPGGTVVHDDATVAKTSGTPAAAPNPTGTVTFTLYDNGTCDGNVVATDPNEPLNSSGTASSATFTTPAVLGPYSYLAHYNGDANYPQHDGPCEPFNFDGVPPVTTITLDPSTPDSCCWYIFAVRASISATDVGTGVAETRCVLDPAVPPATFDDLPATPCPYLAPGAYILTEGIHTLYAASRDVAGNKETPVSKMIKLDKTPPTSTMGPQPTFQPNPGPFTVSWSATDATSGVKDYDVRYRVAPAGGSFGAYTQWFTDTTQTSAQFTPTPGSTVCFSVKARDNACWEEPHYGPEVCTTAPYDDPSLAHYGSWSTVTGSGYFGPGVSRSTSPGNKLTLASLRGSVIGVLATKQPGGGTIELRWNGFTKATINLNAASVQKKQLITFNLGSVQTGTLDIVQTGYGTVDIDAAGAYKDS